MFRNKYSSGLDKGDGRDFVELHIRDFHYIIGARFHIKKKASWRLLRIFSSCGLAKYTRRRAYLCQKLYALLVNGIENDGKKD